MDNHEMISYREKIAGKKNRTKIRFRNYSNSKNLNKNYNLELKIRSADKLKKISTKVKSDNIFLKNNDIKSNNYVIRIVSLMKKFQNYKKKLLIYYDRIALFDNKNKNLRLTIDSNLFVQRYVSENNFGMKIRFLPINYRILEIKTDKSIPFWLHLIIKKYGLVKSPISKYGRAVQAMSKNYSLEI